MWTCSLNCGCLDNNIAASEGQGVAGQGDRMVWNMLQSSAVSPACGLGPRAVLHGIEPRHHQSKQYPIKQLSKQYPFKEIFSHESKQTRKYIILAAPTTCVTDGCMY